MTNGEIIQKVFTCEVCEPIPEDDIIHVIFSDKSDSAIGFDWSWWNMEYKEPTIKNDLAQERYQDLIEYFGDEKVAKTILESRKEFKAWLERLRWNVKRADELARELEQIKGTTKNDLVVDCISRKSIKQKLQEHHDFFVNAYGGFSNLPQNDKSRVDEITNCIAMVVNEPPVTPQEPQTFKWCTDCSEYDQEKHCCHRWSKVIRDTVEEMKQEYIEREVLDKIKSQIEDYLRGVEITLEVLVENDPLRPKMEGAKATLEECLELIDKADKEQKENDN